MFKKFQSLAMQAITNNPVNAETNKQTLMFICTLMVCVAAFAPELAFAQGGGGAPWDNAAQRILGILNGGLTRTLAIIAVVAMGIAAFAGKLSWDWAIKIIVGIVFVFGGAAIVDAIIGAVGS